VKLNDTTSQPQGDDGDRPASLPVPATGATEPSDGGRHGSLPMSSSESVGGHPLDGLRRWQDFYAFLIEDSTKWAGIRALVRAVPELMPDALLITDAAGFIVLVNRQLELMFGYHRSEVVGKTPEVFLPVEQRARHVELRHAYANAPHSRPMGSTAIFVARRKNGTACRVRVTLGPVPTPEGTCIIAVIRRVEASEAFGRPVIEQC
jgi:PAS domain S-box-containing protein